MKSLKEIFESKIGITEAKKPIKIKPKFELDPWAAEMIKVIEKVPGAGKLSKELAEEPDMEGTEIKKALGLKIIEAFKKDGWKPFEQIKDLWVIESKKDETVGISLDYREDMDYSSGCCLINFFDDTY